MLLSQVANTICICSVRSLQEPLAPCQQPHYSSKHDYLATLVLAESIANRRGREKKEFRKQSEKENFPGGTRSRAQCSARFASYFEYDYLAVNVCRATAGRKKRGYNPANRARDWQTQEVPDVAVRQGRL